MVCIVKFLGDVMVCVVDYKREMGLWHCVLTVSYLQWNNIELFAVCRSY